MYTSIRRKGDEIKARFMGFYLAIQGKVFKVWFEPTIPCINKAHENYWDTLLGI